ncbi:MAG: cation diffusion facilitator family transporter [Clostridia bacterium]|nr:cation diffusion facilitator family transporter [Clostridia bacterium]
MQSTDLKKTAVKTSVVTIIINFLLSAFKLAAGILGNSLAMISDAIHSASDVFSTIIVIIGVKAASKAPDKNHQFGHERFECVAAIILAVLLLGTGIFIGYSGVSNIVTGAYKNFEIPTYLALSAAVVSIVVKEAMFFYTIHAAKKCNSGALKADAWHHQSDALSSVGSLVGIVGAMLGVLILDSIASIVICLLILKAAVEIFIDAINKMTDRACDEKTENEIKEFILSCEGVKRLDSLMTRLFGNRIYVIAEISCESEISLHDAHDVAERVHTGIEQNFPLVKHVTVHVNPYEENTDGETETGKDE